MDITQLPTWSRLAEHRLTFDEQTLAALFAADAARFDRFSATGAGILLDYSKNFLTAETVALLVELANARNLDSAIGDMFTGVRINNTEQRAALHTALRARDGSATLDLEDVSAEVTSCLDRMAAISHDLREGHWLGAAGKPITDVVTIGIGGSYLGPKAVFEALRHRSGKPMPCHFVANVDGLHISEVLRRVDPETTLFIVISKSFTTLETKLNAETARRWLTDAGVAEAALNRHFLAVTSQVDRASEFGIDPEYILPMWDWVGGRYSLWSAVGLPICIGLGFDTFREVLEGAARMDRHFQTAPLAANLPVLMALVALWYVNFFDASNQAVIPYDHHLRVLPAHLQQLEMESNGKSVGRDGTKVQHHTAPIVWGGEGTNGQHAFHQLLHQGTRFVMADFIIALETDHELEEHHRWLYANCLSQTQALLLGKSEQAVIEELKASGMSEPEAKHLAPHKAIPGNRPSNTIVLPDRSPGSIGALVALYEHKIFTLGALWQINPFDQWGVELGKELSDSVFDHLGTADAAGPELDASTSGLAALYRNSRS